MRTLLLIIAVVLIPACRTNESPEGQVNDFKIAAEVKSKLASNVGISSVANIAVDSTNRVVTLSGQVDSPEIRQRAEAAARSVRGVVRVVDMLQVAAQPQ